MAIVSDRLSKFLDLPDQKSRLESVPVFSLLLLLTVTLQSFFFFFFNLWGNLGKLSSLAWASQLISLPLGFKSSQDVCLWHAQLTSFLKNLGVGQNRSILHYDLRFMKSSSPLFKYFARGEESSQFH